MSSVERVSLGHGWVCKAPRLGLTAAARPEEEKGSFDEETCHLASLVVLGFVAQFGTLLLWGSGLCVRYAKTCKSCFR
jgi:hypothetical protein